MPTTRTTTITVFKYSELSESAKDHACENLSNINVDTEWWDFDCLTGFSSKEIAKHHLTPDEAKFDFLTYKEMYFDLDRGSYIQFKNCQFGNDETARKFLGVPKNIWNRVYWDIIDIPGRNSNTRLEWNWEGDNEITKKQEEILERAVERFSDKVEEALSSLKSTCDYLTSKEASPVKFKKDYILTFRIIFISTSLSISNIFFSLFWSIVEFKTIPD